MLVFSNVWSRSPQIKSVIVSVNPNIRFASALLKKGLNENPEIIIIPAIMRRAVSGYIKRPEVIPAQRGKQILRNGISLFSTVFSDETV